MTVSRTHLPEGVQDFLPEECGLKKDIEQKLRREFTLNGFQEVETPSFEYYDVFSKGIGAYMQENMVKFFDLKGRIMVLRPDVTVPISRMVGTSMSGVKAPRLFYIQNAFAVNDYNIGQRSEFTQAGVEYMGRGGSSADAELIALAVKSMLCIGLRDFKVDIGQVGYFKGLIQSASLAPEEENQLRKLIDSKNNIELEYMLSSVDCDWKIKEKLFSLPGLFGGREIISQARLDAPNEACRQALDNLDQVFSALEGFGYGQYISVDLGMLHNYGYYSGVIFKGVSGELGFPILSGGRYDGLAGEFGQDRPAIGFALGIKRALIALERQGALTADQPTVAIVGATASSLREGYAFAESLREKGVPVIFRIVSAEADLAPQEENRSIAEIYYFDGQMKRLD